MRHGFDRNDALDGKVRLVAGSQAIRRRPASSTFVSRGSVSAHRNNLLIINKQC